MRIFVTGATGVVGRRALPTLVAAGHAVSAVGRTPAKRAMLEHQGATPIALDLLDATAVRRAIAGHDVVINLATHIPPTSRMMVPGAWRENDRLRGVASSYLVDAALAGGVGRFIQESFAPVYADAGDAWIDEAAAIRASGHTRSVLDAERAVDRFTRSGGAGVVLRFALFYGPDSAATRDLIRGVRHGWALIAGSPEAYISSVSHDDAAAAVVVAVDVEPGRYNVADDEPLRRREFFGSLARALGVAPPRMLPAWTAGLMGSAGRILARSLRISNRALRDRAGWAPAYPGVREGWPALVRDLEA